MEAHERIPRTIYEYDRMITDHTGFKANKLEKKMANVRDLMIKVTLAPSWQIIWASPANTHKSLGLSINDLNLAQVALTESRLFSRQLSDGFLSAFSHQPKISRFPWKKLENFTSVFQN